MMSNCSLELIGAAWSVFSSYWLRMVLPTSSRSMLHRLQKSRKLKLRLLQLRQTQSPTRSVSAFLLATASYEIAAPASQ